ncbi:hypothetical protein ACFV0C_36975 [Streptomyces sp. NPDC059568]|uniref:hypothetical protein n=1 Tax=Streptomyces sp. NPDC059568 TaxID=3346868 RepID=UPI0036A285F0
MSSTEPEADGEQVLRKWLRRKIDGPAADEAPAPLVHVHVVPGPAEPEPDDEAEDDEELEDEEDQEAEQRPARDWWSLPRRKPTEPVQPHPVEYAPGVHVTINQPKPAAPPSAPPVDERAQRRRTLIRRWLVFHGSGAAVGWYAGLGPSMAQLLLDSGHSAPAVGIGLILVTLIPASYLPGLPHIPPPLRPITVWLCRIPAATAALALVLNSPNALI